MPATDAVILLGRGGTGAAARDSLQHLADALQPRLPGTRIEVAFVDKAASSLPEALARCADAREVAVLPLLAPDEPALTRWLLKVAMRWRAHQGGDGPRIRFAPALLAADLLPDLVCRQLAQPADDIADTAGAQWAQDPVAWSSVPAHTHHVLVCTGPRCTAIGAVAVWEAVAEALKAEPELQRRVRPLQTSCQYPCNHGPLAIAYPEGVWYGRLEPQHVPAVLQAHVLEGRPCEQHVVHRLTRS